jgi:hypothetical protein
MLEHFYAALPTWLGCQLINESPSHCACRLRSFDHVKNSLGKAVIEAANASSALCVYNLLFNGSFPHLEPPTSKRLKRFFKFLTTLTFFIFHI